MEQPKTESQCRLDEEQILEKSFAISQNINHRRS